MNTNCTQPDRGRRGPLSLRYVRGLPEEIRGRHESGLVQRCRLRRRSSSTAYAAPNAGFVGDRVETILSTYAHEWATLRDDNLGDILGDAIGGAAS